MRMVLNELSLCTEKVHQSEAVRVLEQFINTYSKAVKGTNGFERSILTSVDLNSLKLAKGYYVSKWRNNTQDKDMLRRFVNMCDRQGILEVDQGEAELRCEKGYGKGLLAAYENESFCISFNTEPYWNMFEIPCQYYSLKEDQTFHVRVYNLSSEAQLEKYSGQISEMKEKEISGIRTPQQLLECLDELFPSLIFHQVALNQLEGQVQACHVGALCNKLMSLERYFSKWDGERFEEEAFPSRSVSPQSKSTLERFKKEHTFEFTDAQVLVSYHMRYTGNIPGRIYFHPAYKLRKAYICSLTTKLPTVSEPKKHI